MSTSLCQLSITNTRQRSEQQQQWTTHYLGIDCDLHIIHFRHDRHGGS